jgi:hypothetical protein
MRTVRLGQAWAKDGTIPVLQAAIAALLSMNARRLFIENLQSIRPSGNANGLRYLQQWSERPREAVEETIGASLLFCFQSYVTASKAVRAHP